MEERETLERELRGRELNKTQVGDVKMSDLPGMEALARPGELYCPLAVADYPQAELSYYGGMVIGDC